MALADYDTAAEKIAALKAAMIDPALTIYDITSADITLSENVFTVQAPYVLNGVTLSSYADESMSLPSLMFAGDTFKATAGRGIMYVKDSDIVYSEPVTTYQNRLSTIATSKLIYSAGWTVGSHGALLKRMDTAATLIIDGKEFQYDKNGINRLIPLKSNDVISGHISPAFAYIDLPVDW